jgi:type VI secretion system secreted protein Hcp
MGLSSSIGQAIGGLVATATPSAVGAVDFFLKIDGIDGESADAKHKGEIEVEAWEWGESQAGSHAYGGGGGVGKVVMHDFHFTMKVNKASPKLMLACANGEHIPNAVLTCRKAGKDQQEYLKIHMHDLLVSSFQVGGHGGTNVVPLERVSLNFRKIEYVYKEQRSDGSLGAAHKAGWDQKVNQKF